MRLRISIGTGPLHSSPELSSQSVKGLGLQLLPGLVAARRILTSPYSVRILYVQGEKRCRKN